MPELGVTEFSMIVVTSGKPKQTKVRNISKRAPYAHYKDYYLSLRTGIKSIFTKKRPISYLYTICKKQTDASKKSNYEKITSHFDAWQSGKNITAFPPPKGFYHYSSTDITCNPELHVVLHGQPRLVKLHFNTSEAMTQERANIICALMEEAIDDDGFEYSVLDLTTGRELFFSGDYEKTFFRVNKEIKALEDIWDI